MAARGAAGRQVIRTVAAAMVAAVCAVAVACAEQAHNVQPTQAPDDLAAVAAAATFPPGPEGALIAYGHDLIEQTPKYMSANIGARMSCAACHPNVGRVPQQGSFLGLYAKYPQWNKRAHRFIALQDRIAECFLYSMNGKPPAYSSKEMIAMTAYIAFLSRGAVVGSGFADQEPPALTATVPNAKNGSELYAARCSACHGAGGNGLGVEYPPLWGADSFNDKAGMSRLARLAPFIRRAMPQNAPGTLTDQQALDLAAYILTHPRPHFNAKRQVQFAPEAASYF
jgi:thiosulfate dehydrogenase